MRDVAARIAGGDEQRLAVARPARAAHPGRADRGQARPGAGGVTTAKHGSCGEIAPQQRHRQRPARRQPGVVFRQLPDQGSAPIVEPRTLARAGADLGMDALDTVGVCRCDRPGLSLPRWPTCRGDHSRRAAPDPDARRGEPATQQIGGEIGAAHPLTCVVDRSAATVDPEQVAPVRSLCGPAGCVAP